MYLWTFQGNLGEGKTSAMSIFAHYYASRMKRKKIELFSNYGLAESRELKHYSDFYEVARCHGSIVCIDEAQTSLDARLFSKGNNIYLTQFMFYLRKLGCSWFLATPAISNLDSRVRMLTNVLVDCHKTPKGFSYNIYDYQAKESGPYGKLLKRKFLPMPRAKEIFNTGLYDTYKIIRSIPFPANEREFDKFLSEIITVHEEAMSHERSGKKNSKSLSSAIS